MRFIAFKQKYFLFGMEENRMPVTDESARNQGLWQNISQLEIPENVPVKVCLKTNPRIQDFWYQMTLLCPEINSPPSIKTV
jgi:hypothetical protein